MIIRNKLLSIHPSRSGASNNEIPTLRRLCLLKENSYITFESRQQRIIMLFQLLMIMMKVMLFNGTIPKPLFGTKLLIFSTTERLAIKKSQQP